MRAPPVVTGQYLPVTGRNAKELHTSRVQDRVTTEEVKRCWGSRARAPHVPLGEHQIAHKTNSAGLKVAAAAGRREIRTAVLAQGLDPPGDEVLVV